MQVALNRIQLLFVNCISSTQIIILIQQINSKTYFNVSYYPFTLLRCPVNGAETSLYRTSGLKGTSLYTRTSLKIGMSSTKKTAPILLYSLLDLTTLIFEWVRKICTESLWLPSWEIWNTYAAIYLYLSVMVSWRLHKLLFKMTYLIYNARQQMLEYISCLINK